MSTRRFALEKGSDNWYEAPRMGVGMRGDIDNAGYIAFFDALLERRLKLGQTLKQEELGDILGQSLSPMRETTTLLEAEA